MSASMPTKTKVKPRWQRRFYEDFEAGDVHQHPLGRTISETDGTWSALLTMNTAEPHFNIKAGKASAFGKILVPSTLTLAIAAGQNVIDTSQDVFAYLGWERGEASAPRLRRRQRLVRITCAEQARLSESRLSSGNGQDQDEDVEPAR